MAKKTTRKKKAVEQTIVQDVQEIKKEEQKENKVISALKWIVGSGVLTLAVSQGPNLWQKYQDYRNNINEKQRVERESQKQIALSNLQCINNNFVTINDESKNEIKVRICSPTVVLIEFPNKEAGKESIFRFIQIDKIAPDQIAVGSLFAQKATPMPPRKEKVYQTTQQRQQIKVLCKKEIEDFILFYVKNVVTGKCNINKFNMQTLQMTNNISDRPIDCNNVCKGE